jgi:hypothetical protein
MGKPFWEGAKQKRKKKLWAGQCTLLKATMVHFTKFSSLQKFQQPVPHSQMLT